MKKSTQKKREKTQINNQKDPGSDHSAIDFNYIDYVLGYDNTDNEYDNNTLYEELPIEKWYFD